MSQAQYKTTNKQPYSRKSDKDNGKMGFKEFISKNLRLLLYTSLFLGSIAFAIWGYIAWVLLPQLPAIDSLKTTQLKTTLRVYSKDNLSIAQYGSERRIPINAKVMPEIKLLTKAILAAEDDRFYQHAGVDVKGIIRAIVSAIKTGKIRQGASTITMQVARNFFLTRERSFNRKAKEILLALEIERHLTKEEILLLYFNKIFLGHHAYGFGAAAQVYYGRSIQELTLAQYAMLATLPKAPSANNPLRNPKRALIRRDYILRRMLTLKYINEKDYLTAVASPLTATKKHLFRSDLEANYVGEMARNFVIQRYGKKAAYSNGYKVYTTIDGTLQENAKTALRKALIDYDTRHGYRGAMAQLKLSASLQTALKSAEPADLIAISTTLDKIMTGYAAHGHLQPALVLKVHNKKIQVYHKKAGMIEISWKNMRWARRYINDFSLAKRPRNAHQIVNVGDVILVEEKRRKIIPKKTDKEDNLLPHYQRYWRLAQAPQVSGAFVVLNPQTGAIISLMGGFDFHHSKFNRVTQAQRQVGSNFKPFVYSAALANGYTPATLVNDAPIVIKAGNKIWRPQNYSGKFSGPMRLRKALKLSRNLVSIRLMKSLGVKTVLDYVTKFGFERETLPPNLTLSLGSVSLPPLKIAEGFSVFANGGYKLSPYFIERIEDHTGKTIYQAEPLSICPDIEPMAEPTDLESLEDAETLALANSMAQEGCAPRVITVENAWLITSILKDVITSGTGRRAKKLKRPDLAGKTGTTNEQRDAWFSGYNSQYVATAWVGFDQPRSLGKKETGGKAALPIWINFMQKSLVDQPIIETPKPEGLIAVKIDKRTGLLAHANSGNSLLEYFPKGQVPTRHAQASSFSYNGFNDYNEYVAPKNSLNTNYVSPVPEATPVKTLEQNLF